MRVWILLVLFVGCLSCSAMETEQSEIASSLPFSSAPRNRSAMEESTTTLALQNSVRSNQNIYGNTYRINLGPQLVSVKTAIRETAQSKTLINRYQESANMPRYFDLRATSVLAGTSVVGDGEMSYSIPDSSADSMRPAMVRFGLANRWRDLTYGADYKSVTKGFVSRTGAIADQSRDEAVIWGEHGVGPFNLRGSIGESWERLIDTADRRVTRSATAAIQINRARWAGSFSTTYGLIERGAGPNEENTVLIKRITASYRPADFLSLEPNFTVKEERNQSTGERTQTPTAGLLLTYSPLQSAIRLTGGTSFSRIFDRDGSNDVSVHGTSAVVDWKIGKFLGRNDTLSFTFNYNRQLDHVFRTNSYDGLSSMLQFKIAGF